ncbi:MAG: hypothetical protein GWP03_05090 [Proteobacteria bacterium]|nr:hypothetical protein [Pseudomonadota bacterium]
MKIRIKSFANLKRIKVFFFLVYVIFFITGCAGTFRTAEVLKKGKKTTAISIPMGIGYMDGEEYFILYPELSFKYGLGNRMEAGAKVYLVGAEISMCRNILKEGRFNPAVALQLNTGLSLFYGATVETDLLFSKRIGSVSLYSAIRYKLMTDVSDFYNGKYRSFLYSGGIQLPGSKKIKMYLEVYNTPIYRFSLDEEPYFSNDILIGFGIKIKIGN